MTVKIIASADSYIEGVVGPTSNFGSEVGTLARVVDSAGDKSFWARAIGNFNLAAYAGHTITSASLHFYHYNRDGAASAYIARCTRPATWVEDEVTWERASDAQAWTDDGGDFDDGTPTKVTFSLAGSTGWQEVTGLKGHVDDAIANRSNVLAIIVRLADEDPETTTGHIWRALDYGSLEWYIELNVSYVEAVAATATALAGVPVVRAAATVIAGAGTATALSGAPTVGAGAGVAAVVAAATALAGVAAVGAGAGVAAVAATATALAGAPVVTGSSPDATVEAVAATATAKVGDRTSAYSRSGVIRRMVPQVW